MTTTVPIHRTETIAPDGRLNIHGLPLPAGLSVEVIIVPRIEFTADANRESLRGTPVHYEGPFDPVADDEWEAAQ
jgi:hypothetical protein